jgi:hypothetical protein
MVDVAVKGIKPSPEANSPILLITKGAPLGACQTVARLRKG